MNEATATNGKEKTVAEELLLCLLRPAADGEVDRIVRSLLERSPDWRYLIWLAGRHKVAPMVYHRLSAFADEVPERLLTKLRERYRATSFVNMALTGKLVRVLAQLQEHNIPALAYKGPVLAQSAYGDPNLRQFTDLDILVRKQDIHKIKELLVANGCQPLWRLTPAQEAAVLRHHYEFPFLWNDGNRQIEIHWDFAEHFFSFAFDLDQIWARSETVVIHEQTIRTLSLEDSMLVLCAHGSKHFWGRLSWICDIANTIFRHPELDWQILTERASALGLRRILSLSLFLTYNLLGLELPAEVSRMILSEPRIPELARQIRETLFRTVNAESGPGSLRATLFQLRIRERARDKLNYSFRLIVMTKLVDSLLMPMGRPR